MSVILLPDKWRRQPRGPVTVDAANGLARGLFSFVTSAGGVARDLQAGINVQLSADAKVSPTVAGLGVTLDGTGDYASAGVYNKGNFFFSAGQSVFFEIVPAFSSASNTRQGVIHFANGTASGDIPRLRVIWLSASSGFYVDTKDGYAYSAAPSFAAGDVVRGIFTRTGINGGQWQFFNRGATSTKVADFGDGYAFSGADPSLYLGWDAENASCVMAGSIITTAAWSGGLSTGEAQAVLENPYQLLRKQPRILYFTAPSGGGATYNETVSEALAAVSAQAPLLTAQVARAETTALTATPVSNFTALLQRGEALAAVAAPGAALVTNATAPTALAAASTHAGATVTTADTSNSAAVTTEQAQDGATVLLGAESVAVATAQAALEVATVQAPQAFGVTDARTLVALWSATVPAALAVAGTHNYDSANVGYVAETAGQAAQASALQTAPVLVAEAVIVVHTAAPAHSSAATRAEALAVNAAQVSGTIVAGSVANALSVVSTPAAGTAFSADYAEALAAVSTVTAVVTLGGNVAVQLALTDAASATGQHALHVAFTAALADALAYAMGGAVVVAEALGVTVTAEGDAFFALVYLPDGRTVRIAVDIRRVLVLKESRISIVNIEGHSYEG